MNSRLYLYENSHFLDFLYKCLSALVSVHTFELTCNLIEGCIVIHNVYLFKVMTLSYKEVIRVMGRSNLYASCSLFHIRILVCDNRYFTVNKRNNNLLTYKVNISLIFGVNCNGSIAEKCFGTGSSYNDIFVAVFNKILDMPVCTVLFGVFNLGIGKCCLTVRAPVSNSVTSVDKSLVIEVYKYVFYCL